MQRLILPTLALALAGLTFTPTAVADDDDVARGKITDVDLEHITVHEFHDHDNLTLHVDEDTRIRVDGQSGDLDDLEEGMYVTVRSEDGVAEGIIARSDHDHEHECDDD